MYKESDRLIDWNPSSDERNYEIALHLQAKKLK